MTVLANELIRDCTELSCHKFGHHVIEAVLEHCDPTLQARLVAVLVNDFWWLALDGNASYVIETAIMHCGAQEQQAFVAVVVSGDADGVKALVACAAGVRVIRALVKLDDDNTARLIQLLQSMAPLLRQNSQ